MQFKDLKVGDVFVFADKPLGFRYKTGKYLYHDLWGHTPPTSFYGVVNPDDEVEPRNVLTRQEFDDALKYSRCVALFDQSHRRVRGKIAATTVFDEGNTYDKYLQPVPDVQTYGLRIKGLWREYIANCHVLNKSHMYSKGRLSFMEKLSMNRRAKTVV